MPDANGSTIAEEFIARWAPSGGAERSNYQLFLAELCDLLDVPRPDPAQPDNEVNAYVFERSVAFVDGDGRPTTNYIDCYRQGCFVCETKQGVDAASGIGSDGGLSDTPSGDRKQGHGKRGTSTWNSAMRKARGQGERYIRALPASEGRPPFLLVVDVGYVIEIYAEFTRSGGQYTPFPDARSHRITLDDLRDETIRSRLRAIWTEPLSLDPSRISAAITRDLAARLAKLARSLELDGYEPDQVSAFLMRCLFTMFAEDVGLLPHRSFTDLLTSLRHDPEFFRPSMEQLWATMNAGGASTQLRKKLLRFNGGLFAEQEALALSANQIDLLVECAKADWQNVEPAIFGTLLERALDPAERHKLGAHYTPREYVERLVLPTIVEPLRDDWASVEAAAVQHDEKGDTKAAVRAVEDFLNRLTQVRVLDPACGSGNFLYVTLEHLKRLEGEVLDTLHAFGAGQTSFETAGITVDPHQLLGLEVNPRAVAIADIVLWIGYLQWHFRTHGNNVLPPEPVLQNFHNIRHADALIEWDDVKPVLDGNGEPVTHWDGRTTKFDPLTGREVPDETARLPEQRYFNPRKAEWPVADFIIGNPPYLGARVIRDAVGSGYLEALRSVYDHVPQNADYVMYWWDRAAELVRAHKIRRFGLITTNSIRQSFCRRVLEPHLKDEQNFRIEFCVPDHPWIDAHLGASVRVAMTVGTDSGVPGRLLEIQGEEYNNEGVAEIDFRKSTGFISPALTVDYDPAGSPPLTANSGVSSVGYQLSGKGFVLNRNQISRHFKHVSDGVIKPLLSGRDIMQRSRDLFAIDVCGFSEAELRDAEPEIYQWLATHVKPERDQNKRKSVAEKWWIYGEARNSFRPALSELETIVATSLTARHRVFVRVPAGTVADSTTVVFALDDLFYFGVLSSRAHLAWVKATGGTLEDRPRYNKSVCFDNFPFPNARPPLDERIRNAAAKLDDHRKQQLSKHPQLTLTHMYNVLEKERAGEPLNERDRVIHELALVTVLRELHADLDNAVAEAYGWPESISENSILENLIALNQSRDAEERAGTIRWLRPEYQNPDGESPTTQDEINVTVQADDAKSTTQKLPTELPERVTAIRAALSDLPGGGDVETIASRFKSARRKTISEILETLTALGQIRRDSQGFYHY